MAEHDAMEIAFGDEDESYFSGDQKIHEAERSGNDLANELVDSIENDAVVKTAFDGVKAAIAAILADKLTRKDFADLEAKQEAEDELQDVNTEVCQLLEEEKVRLDQTLQMTCTVTLIWRSSIEDQLASLRQSEFEDQEALQNNVLALKIIQRTAEKLTSMKTRVEAVERTIRQIKAELVPLDLLKPEQARKRIKDLQDLFVGLL